MCLKVSNKTFKIPNSMYIFFFDAIFCNLFITYLKDLKPLKTSVVPPYIIYDFLLVEIL